MASGTKQVIFQITSAFMAGNSRKCPLCDKSFRKFLSHGIGPIKRKDVKCPNCRSLERHRALWLFLGNEGLLDQISSLLHCAPEPQLFEQLKRRPGINYVTTDYCVPGCSVYMDLTKASLKSKSFDSIICNHVLEHIVDDRMAMAELYRVLKTDGWAILQSPIDVNRADTYEDPSINTDDLRQKYYKHFDHKRLYGLDYKDRLTNAGFVVEVKNFIQDMPPRDAELYGLDLTERIYFCTKPAAES